MLFSGRSFSDSGRNIRQILHAPASWVCVLTIVAIQTGIFLNGGPESLSSWFETLGLSRTGFLSGNLWQILSYSLLHGSWLHTGMNVLFVLFIGSRIEYIAGWGIMVRTITAGILGGGISHILLGHDLLVGLSGGCVALLLLLTTLSPQSRMFPLPISGRSLGIGIMLAEPILTLIDPALRLPGLSSVGEWLSGHGAGNWFLIGHACHVGGGLAGWWYGRWLLRPRVTLASLRRDRERREQQESEKSAQKP